MKIFTKKCLQNITHMITLKMVLIYAKNTHKRFCFVFFRCVFLFDIDIILLFQ